MIRADRLIVRDAQDRTSVPAVCSLLLMVAGYFAIAVIAGAPRSPLTVPLPAGARSPSWATSLATHLGLDHAPRNALIGVSWVLIVTVLAAFTVLLNRAWRNRVRLEAVLIASGISLATITAGPLLLSRDVYTYAAYGRIDALYHHDPYVAPLSAFPHDPYVAVSSAQWHQTHSIYGPLFTFISALIVKTWAHSPSATILAFKLLASLAIATATGLTALAAVRTRPKRAAFAAALVGLNPVLVIHTVGGAHIDALIAVPLAAAMVLAVAHPPVASARAMAVTVLLTSAFLVKAATVPALALWLWWLVQNRRSRHGRFLTAHVTVLAGLTLASLAPFLDGWHTFAPLTTLGGVEAWASPSHLAGRVTQMIVDSVANSDVGSAAAKAVAVGFLLWFLLLGSRLARQMNVLDPAPAENWGVALLLLALTMPYLLPWYAAWFAPFLGLLADDGLALAGTVVTGILALTLIPADPFHGLSSPAVMKGVHYGAAPALLVLLMLVASRTARTVSASPELARQASTG